MSLYVFFEIKYNNNNINKKKKKVHFFLNGLLLYSIYVFN